MPPQTICPNCTWNDWNQGKPCHVPLALMEDDEPAVDMSKGITVIPWKCSNCHYVMLFWEPDTNRDG